MNTNTIQHRDIWTTAFGKALLLFFFSFIFLALLDALPFVIYSIVILLCASQSGEKQKQKHKIDFFVLALDFSKLLFWNEIILTPKSMHIIQFEELNLCKFLG